MLTCMTFTLDIVGRDVCDCVVLLNVDVQTKLRKKAQVLL